MEERSYRDVSQAIAALKTYLPEGVASPEQFDLRHALALFHQCRHDDGLVLSPEDRGDYVECCVALLTAL